MMLKRDAENKLTIVTMVNKCSQMFHEDGNPRLEKFDKNLTNLVACWDYIIKQAGVNQYNVDEVR